jgi:hypothetical protein
MELPDRIKDHKLKPLTRFHRPDFSPYRNSYEMDYVLGSADPRNEEQWYLGVININTKYLFMVPMELGKTGSLARTEAAIRKIDEEIIRMTNGTGMIHYIRGDGDKAFGTVVKYTTEEDFDAGGVIDKLTRRVVNKRATRGRDLNNLDILLGNQLHVQNNFTSWLENAHKGEGIELFLDSSPYTNKVRVIDRAIRTIRDMVGENQELLSNPDIMAHVVAKYNRTPHTAFISRFAPKGGRGGTGAFSPLQVQLNPDLEEYFIRENMERLKEVRQLQYEAGFFNYKPGNILLIHLDKSKTQESFDKKRRAFNELAVFIEYQNGNVLCRRLTRDEYNKIIPYRQQVLIPIYYTKYLAPSVQEIPRRFQQLVF